MVALVCVCKSINTCDWIPLGLSLFQSDCHTGDTSCGTCKSASCSTFRSSTSLHCIERPWQHVCCSLHTRCCMASQTLINKHIFHLTSSAKQNFLGLYAVLTFMIQQYKPSPDAATWWIPLRNKHNCPDSTIFTTFLAKNTWQDPSTIARDQPNSREKMRDLTIEFLKCAKFHGKFTEGVWKIHWKFMGPTAVISRCYVNAN